MTKQNDSKYPAARPLLYQPRLWAAIALLLLVLASLLRAASAQTVTEGFKTEKQLQRGMLVSLQAKDASKIEATNYDNAAKLHGVVVNPNDAPLTLSNENEKTFVASVGKYDALVSTQNGPINPGDYIAPSALEGIGAKADKESSIVVGKAIAAFDGKNSLSTASITTSDGKSQTVAIGRIQLDLGIGHNPLASQDANIPEFVAKAAQTLAQKRVDPVRIYIGSIVFVITAVVSGAMLYSGIRAGLISIGRNPLSKKSIIRGLLQVVISSLIVFIIGIFGVYLIVKL